MRWLKSDSGNKNPRLGRVKVGQTVSGTIFITFIVQFMKNHSYQDYYDLHKPPYLSFPCFAPFEIKLTIRLVRLIMVKVAMVVMVWRNIACKKLFENSIDDYGDDHL